MHAESPSPWQPDPSWADPLIALLLTLVCLASFLSLRTRAHAAERPAEQVSLPGRVMEVSLAGPRVLLGRAPSPEVWGKAPAALSNPWDQALRAVLRAEEDPDFRHAASFPSIPTLEGAVLHRELLAAYDQGPLPTTQERADVQRRLGSGYGATLLEARLQDREGGGEPLRAQARRILLVRLELTAALGLLVSILSLGGLCVGIYLAVARPRPRLPLPVWGLSGRAATLVFLGWFLSFFVAGNLAGLLMRPWPTLRWLALPMGYLLHAACGLRLILWAEDLSLKGLWQRVAPGKPGRDLAWGLAFLALAVTLVLAVALVTSPLASPVRHPQRELQELLQGLRGWPSSLLLFLTVAGLAPCFEELLFRGFLFPLLARGGRVGWGLLASALLFGAIHLQPAGLPTLATLGWVMGLAYRQTGSLRTSILVHACWNGSLFVLLRSLG